MQFNSQINAADGVNDGMYDGIKTR